MFHFVISVVSRLLYLGNAFARRFLTLRDLSSHLNPAISPPPPIAFIDAPFSSVVMPEDIPPYPSGDLIVLDGIGLGRQPPPFASPIPSYQSSLITTSSDHPPRAIFIFLLSILIPAIIAGFVIVLPEVVDYFMNITKSVKPASHLFQWVVGPVRIYLVSKVANYLP